MDGGGLGVDQGTIEGLVFLFIHRAVDIIVIAAPVARSQEGLFHIDGFLGDDRGRGIIKVQRTKAVQGRDGPGKCIGCQRSGRDDGILAWKLIDLPFLEAEQRMIFERFGDEVRETFTVDSQRAARGDTRLVRGAHDQRIQPPHFLFQKTGGILQPVRAK